MEFSFIIPNYNGRKWLEKCLDSLVLNSHLGAKEEIIVVDNGSTDGSVQQIKNLKLKIKNLSLIENQKNLGFAQAVNQGIKKSKGEYAVVLNNDAVLAKDWIWQMKKGILKWSGKAKISTFCGRVLTADGRKIEGAGLEFFQVGKAVNRGNGNINRVPLYNTRRELSRHKVPLYNQEEFVFGASGAAAVFSRKALFAAGLFSQDFFAYEEDVDLALRLQDLGWKALYLPRAVCFHRGGATSAQMGSLRRRMDIVNWWLIIIKHYPWRFFFKNLPGILFERLRNLNGLIEEVPFFRLPGEIFLILVLFLQKLPRAIKKRQPLGFLTNYDKIFML